MAPGWVCRTPDGSVRTIASVHRVQGGAVTPIDLRAVRADGGLVRAHRDPAAIDAWRLDLTDRTGGLADLAAGTWAGGAFEPSSAVPGRLSFERPSPAWDATAVAYADDEPVWAADGSGLWVQPGATRLNGVVSLNPPVNRTTGFSTTDQNHPSPFGAVAETWFGSEPGYIEQVGLPTPVVGTTYTTLFHVYAGKSCAVDWRKFGAHWSDPEDSARLALPVGWSHHRVTAPASSNAAKFLADFRNSTTVTDVEIAVADIQISATTYAPLPILAAAGVAGTVAPDALTVAFPATAKTLLLDLAEYRGGDGAGCLVHVAGAGTLRIEPASGAVRYDDAAGWSLKTTSAVAPTSAAKIALASDGSATRLTLDGGVVATHAAGAQLIPALATSPARLGNDGAGGATLAKWRGLTAVAPALPAAELRAATA